MSFDSPGAVLLLEVRVSAGARHAPPKAIEDLLTEARVALEAPAAGRQWIPTAGAGVAGRLTLQNPTETFLLVHRLRTDLRSDPRRPPVDLIVGMGRGDEMEASRLAGDGFRALARKRNRYTRAVTSNADVTHVLDAICRAIDELIHGWTAAQWQAISHRDQGRTLQQIGKDLGIAYQNVSKRLIAARYSLYRDLLDAAGLLFSRNEIGSR